MSWTWAHPATRSVGSSPELKLPLLPLPLLPPTKYHHGLHRAALTLLLAILLLGDLMKDIMHESICGQLCLDSRWPCVFCCWSVSSLAYATMLKASEDWPSKVGLLSRLLCCCSWWQLEMVCALLYCYSVAWRIVPATCLFTFCTCFMASAPDMNSLTAVLLHTEAESYNCSSLRQRNGESEEYWVCLGTHLLSVKT